jgi:hypothetical protein
MRESELSSFKDVKESVEMFNQEILDDLKSTL